MTAEVRTYIEKRLELMVVSVSGNLADLISGSIQRLIGAVFLFGALVFLLIALALYLGSLLGSLSLGFVLVSVPLLAAGFCLYLLKPNGLRKKIKLQLTKQILALFDYDMKHDNKLMNSDTSQPLKKEENHV